ncbi:MAG: tRNA (N6-threonylcarbamoyladenosine(37)-N6)-methyltransferase TrmO [Deltaproteobacteria bacterium]|jgi:tRNA-Thr(GGU) m(6)t(6)A37 methyltransferase TsaA|nr:tRNA (N6-threonylcarbamoyladenosine(37)-N6)-methyltransferase TrmO [Deltaproteobacteria bacterium]MCW8893605.1 tRNA (N6-threonylcarbamoyladenosine(37)-N6)-methyltransferase TrmO [Deltaproteobacteria bacterium]
MKISPIGIIHSPFKELSGMPIQPSGAKGANGWIEVFAEFQSGLKDLEGFSHIILLYEFHCSREFKLEVIPFMDTKPRGLFATRAPNRPNPVGLSIVKLDKVENGKLYIQNIDILDGSPLIDIKPFVPEFDVPENAKAGWLEHTGKTAQDKKSDDRFK